MVKTPGTPEKQSEVSGEPYCFQRKTSHCFLSQRRQTWCEIVLSSVVLWACVLKRRHHRPPLPEQVTTLAGIKMLSRGCLGVTGVAGDLSCLLKVILSVQHSDTTGPGGRAPSRAGQKDEHIQLLHCSRM